MTGLEIPQKSRRLVATREHERCLRCGGPARPGEWHHRRSRSVRDNHTHCPCNGVLLCGTCHRWAHANPFDARGKGFIVSRHEEDPGVEAVESWYGPLFLKCDGMIEFQVTNGAVNG